MKENFALKHSLYRSEYLLKLVSYEYITTAKIFNIFNIKRKVKHIYFKQVRKKNLDS